MPPWAAIGGAIGGAIFLIALFGGCCICWYRKRTSRARDLENTAANTPDSKSAIVSPSVVVNEVEKAGFDHGRNSDEAVLSPQVVATGEHEFSEPSPQLQVLNASDQLLASGTVPLTPDSGHPLLSAYAAPCAISPSTHFPPKTGGFESSQHSLPQIAPSSFKATVNGEAATGLLREKHEARKEYKQAVAAGKTAYLLEQEATDGKSLKKPVDRTKKLIIFQSFMPRWATSGQILNSRFESLLP